MTSFVRLGGIAAFVAVIAFCAVMGLSLAEVQSEAVKVITVSLLTASLATAFWGTKAFFNARNYRRADLAVYAFAGFLIVFTVFGLAEAAGFKFYLSVTADKIVDIALLTVTIALSALFGIQAMGFASSGGRIWKVIGTLYLAGSIALAFAVAADFAGLAKVSPLLEGIHVINSATFLLTLPASVTLHGIALTLGAGKMQTRVAVA